MQKDQVVDQSRYPRDATVSSEARFKKRLDAKIQEQFAELLSSRVVSTLTDPGAVKVRIKLAEPSFAYDKETGNPEFVLVGNPIYKVGDKIPKPPGGGAGRGGGAGSSAGLGEGEDEFVFEVPRDEIERRLLEGLELPNMEERVFQHRVLEALERAGRQSDGPPAMLDVRESARLALGRRTALHRPKSKDMLALEEQIAEAEALESSAGKDALLSVLKGEWNKARRKRGAVPYFDPSDLRYRRNDRVMKPITKAVVFQLMDRSGSMGQHHKDLAKRFFWLLDYLLRKEYDTVEVVRIAHTDTPMEVDEKEFYFGTTSGGTVVSTALEMMLKIRAERFPLEQYNVYVCQAGDGDTGYNYSGEEDAPTSARIVEQEILQICQYFAYIECHGSGENVQYAGNGKKKSDGPRETPLWQSYAEISARPSHFAMKQVSDQSQIFPTFQNLFAARSDKRRTA
jgi:uncharacterized protein